MRVAVIVSLLGLMSPAIAMAQTQPPASPSAPPTAAAPAPKRGGDITRDAYVERAKRAAENRFDRMDANHDGVLTADERQAIRAKRHASKSQ